MFSNTLWLQHIAKFPVQNRLFLKVFISLIIFSSELGLESNNIVARTNSNSRLASKILHYASPFGRTAVVKRLTCNRAICQYSPFFGCRVARALDEQFPEVKSSRGFLIDSLFATSNNGLNAQERYFPPAQAELRKIKYSSFPAQAEAWLQGKL